MLQPPKPCLAAGLAPGAQSWVGSPLSGGEAVPGTALHPQGTAAPGAASPRTRL